MTEEQNYVILQKGNKKEKHTLEGFCEKANK